MSGKLFIIATPVGNLGDLTLRAKAALAEAEVVFAEDTRVTVKLLNHLGLKRKLVSCHEFNEAKRLALIEKLAAGNLTVALVSDAGTPLISDPGSQIVRRAIELGMPTIPIPGPNAALLALVASGLPCQRFAFEGFPAKRKADRLKQLNGLAADDRTIIFFVAPHDLERFLSEVHEALGDRPACLAREMTKLNEEFRRGQISEILEQISGRTVRGECVLVVGGAPGRPPGRADREELLFELEELIGSGMRLTEAAAQIAKRHGVPKSDVYRLGLGLGKAKADNL